MLLTPITDNSGWFTLNVTYIGGDTGTIFAKCYDKHVCMLGQVIKAPRCWAGSTGPQGQTGNRAIGPGATGSNRQYRSKVGQGPQQHNQLQHQYRFTRTTGSTEQQEVQGHQH